MQPEAEKKLEKIKRFSRVLRRICHGLLAIMASVLVLAVGASFIGRESTVSAFGTSVPLGVLAFHQRCIVAIIVALAIGVLLKVLYHLQRLFGNYARGDIFTTENAGTIRQLGIAALLWTAASIAWIATASAMTHTPGPFHFRLDAVVIGVIVIVISWFMDMAAEMREENELTI